MTPDRVENGVSYVDNPNDLMSMAMQVYRDNGQDIVRLTDYVANTQLPFSVNYENGMVSVGGQMIKPAFVTPDGKAYVDRGALDAAVAKAQDAAGIQNRQDIYAKYDDRYGDMYADLVDRLYNREDFSYNPETDPAYEAYRDMYMREGDRAMRDAMGAAMGASGGYMNSAAATAAAQQNNYYTQQLNDRLPELMQFAYQRYADDFTRNRQALSDIMGLDNQQFNREYGVNNDIINDIRYNNALNEARDDKAYERYWSEKAYNDSIDQWNKTFNETQLNNQLAREAQQVANLSARRVEALRQAQATGQWPAEAAELGFDINSDPFAMDIRRLEMERDNAIKTQQALSDINVAAEKDLATFNNNMSRDNFLWEQQHTPASRSSGGSTRRSSGGSSGGSGTTDNKYEADKYISQWIYSPEGIGGGYLYSDWNANTDPVYAARDKLNNPEVRDAIYYYLRDNGYTDAQATSKLKEYDKNIAEQLEQYEQ